MGGGEKLEGRGGVGREEMEWWCGEQELEKMK